MESSDAPGQSQLARSLIWLTERGSTWTATRRRAPSNLMTGCAKAHNMRHIPRAASKTYTPRQRSIEYHRHRKRRCRSRSTLASVLFVAVITLFLSLLTSLTACHHHQHAGPGISTTSKNRLPHTHFPEATSRTPRGPPAEPYPHAVKHYEAFNKLGPPISVACQPSLPTPAFLVFINRCARRDAAPRKFKGRRSH